MEYIQYILQKEYPIFIFNCSRKIVPLVFIPPYVMRFACGS